MKKETINQEQYYNDIKKLNIAHYTGEISYYSKASLRDIEKRILNKLKAGANLLDLGCGSGRFSIGAAQMGFNVVSVDITPGAVEAAKQRAKQLRITNVNFLCEDMTNLPFKDEIFDYVFCPRFSINAVATIGKRRKALTEMIRVVKLGGMVFVESFNKYYWGRGPLLPMMNFIRDIGCHIRMLLCRATQQSYTGLLPGDITYSANKVVGAPKGYAHLPTVLEIKSWIPHRRNFKLFSIPQLTGKIHWDILKYFRYSIWIIIGEGTLINNKW